MVAVFVPIVAALTDTEKVVEVPATIVAGSVIPLTTKLVAFVPLLTMLFTVSVVSPVF